MSEHSDVPQTPSGSSDDAGRPGLADLATELEIGLDDLDSGRLQDGDEVFEGLLDGS